MLYRLRTLLLAPPLLCLLLCLLGTWASPRQARAQEIFGLNDFLAQMAQGHPLVKQAQLLSEMGRQEIRLARGLFDPKLTSSFETKEFKEVLYFRTWDSQLKIPVWTGTDLKLGYEQNTGQYLNQQLVTPNSGLLYAGVTLPIGQGLLIDARRAALREAQYAKEIAEAERVKLINKVILQATKDYWAWYAAHNLLQVAQKGYDLAKFRFEAVKERVQYGDLAAIDSVEAKITLQERLVMLNSAQVELGNARLMLSNHLWDADGQPLELRPELLPARNIAEQGPELPLEELLAYARENHPELLKIKFKLEQLNVARRLNIEMLKPVLNFNYNFLGQSPAFSQDNSGRFFRNNFKYGIDFSFPLFLRKERAKLAQTNIKISQTELERSQANREIINQLNAIHNDLLNFGQLLTLQESVINNYQTLLDGENERFRLGESSIFLINSREAKLLEGEQKFIDLQFKYAKARAELLWAAGKGL